MLKFYEAYSAVDGMCTAVCSLILTAVALPLLGHVAGHAAWKARTGAGWGVIADLAAGRYCSCDRVPADCITSRRPYLAGFTTSTVGPAAGASRLVFIRVQGRLPDRF